MDIQPARACATKSPAFQFYPKQWLGDDNVMLMDWDARAMHMHFMCIAWQQQEPCTLPDDDDILQKWVGNPGEWQRLKKQIFRAWKLESGRWIQNGLLSEFLKQKDFAAKRRKAAGVRWGHGKADASALHVQCSSSSSSSSNNKNNISSNEKPFDGVPSQKASTDEAKAVMAVWDHYLTATGRNQKTYSFSPLRKRKGLARLREALQVAGGNYARAVELLTIAVDAMLRSDWHMGRDAKTGGKRYIEWEQHLFKSKEQLERWWQINDEA